MITYKKIYNYNEHSVRGTDWELNFRLFGETVSGSNPLEKTGCGSDPLENPDWDFKNSYFIVVLIILNDH